MTTFSKYNLREIDNQLLINHGGAFIAKNVLLVYPSIISEHLTREAINRLEIGNSKYSLSSAIEVNNGKKHSVFLISLFEDKTLTISTSSDFFSIGSHMPRIFYVPFGQVEDIRRHINSLNEIPIQKNIPAPEPIDLNTTKVQEKQSTTTNEEITKDIAKDIDRIESFYERRFDMLNPILKTQNYEIVKLAVGMMNTLLVERRKEIEELRK